MLYYDMSDAAVPYLANLTLDLDEKVSKAKYFLKMYTERYDDEDLRRWNLASHQSKGKCEKRIFSNSIIFPLYQKAVHFRRCEVVK